MANSNTDKAEMASARANVYGLLADVYREEPSLSFLLKLQEPQVSAALKPLGFSLGSVLKESSPDQLVENLAVEYTRLFIGPGSHISPNESMHVESRMGEPNALWGEQTVAVKKFIEGAGVTIADDFPGLPDHITAEFEFMQQLLLKEAEAWLNDEEELGANILGIESRFYEEHISHWVSNFCNKVSGAARHPFYKEFSEITKAFIEFECEIFEDLLAAVNEGNRLSA